MHLATTQRYQSTLPSRTQHGIICPDCKEEVAHECYPHSFGASPTLQPALNEYEQQPPPHTNFTGPIAQGNPFVSAPSASFESSASLPISSDTSSMIIHSNPYAHPSTSDPAGFQKHSIGPTAIGPVFENWPMTTATFGSSISHVPTSSIAASHFATYDAHPPTFQLGKGIRISRI